MPEPPTPLRFCPTAVDATSAEPGLPNEVAVPLDEDHISICKPSSREAQLYKSLLRWLDECVAA
ncbi:hypothetical protein D779_2979 [Imhoffiella purpurea]|uniref:Uncharacterized protein n=1 Tax=Imhoffiella purpurea TaxID=1249627 RepID=W9V435_9GAMM|nr:hypothetical protein D779_2979 [Imhoffiella purpurea]